MERCRSNRPAPWHRRRAERGITFLEVMATGVVLILGLLGAALLVSYTNRQNRRTLSQTQAQIIAERELERISAMRCVPDPPCNNIQLLDDQSWSVYQRANSEVLTTAPGPGDEPAREYHVAIDVDPPVEGSEVGEPALTRDLGNGQSGNQVNVRVTVSWRDTPQSPRRAVVLQTRMAP